MRPSGVSGIVLSALAVTLACPLASTPLAAQESAARPSFRYPAILVRTPYVRTDANMHYARTAMDFAAYDKAHPSAVVLPIVAARD